MRSSGFGQRVAFAIACVGILALGGVGENTLRAGAGVSATVASTHAALVTPPIGKFSSLQHVVIVMMENRAYDNYFGVYCQKTSAVCPMTGNGIPVGTCVKLYPSIPTSQCFAPYNMTKDTWMGLRDLPHTWVATHHAYNNGSMNGFYVAESFHNFTFGHYNGSTIPTYWDMAQQFGLSDTFFSSVMTYSLPNHWYLVAGQSPQVLLGLTITSNKNVTAKHMYLDQANVTPSVETELNAHPNVSWTFYDYALTPYQHAIADLSGSDPGSAYGTWNPMAAQNQSYAGTNPDHFQPRSQFFKDVNGGTLGNISWIIPDAKYSDHLPANVTYGEDFIASIVNTVENSSYWNSTAIFVTWDEYGGWYDHVAPPQLDANGLSLRVPLLVFSPWTPAGMIGHRQLSFDSLLHFVEWRWGLGCLTSRDCNATLPVGFFNFGIHRSPVFFGNSNESVYPYVAPSKPELGYDTAQFMSAPVMVEDETFDWT